ncbi:MAG: RNA 2',3'-cyclic phosphodiesterase [Acidobacteria bacterium]|nr:RNA 2',3'-cyclic phosphodiesterase [Acidobacteriota bacterium]
MRLFTGLDIPDEARAQAAALIDRLRAVSPARWSPAENLHITTKFLGEWPEARLDELREWLSEVTVPEPLTVRLGSIGWFPNPHQPNIIWIAVAEPRGAGRVSCGDRRPVGRRRHCARRSPLYAARDTGAAGAARRFTPGQHRGTAARSGHA